MEILLILSIPIAFVWFCIWLGGKAGAAIDKRLRMSGGSSRLEVLEQDVYKLKRELMIRKMKQ
jgi:hypothetical protein